MKRHERTHTNQFEETQKDTRTRKKPFACSKCDKAFQNGNILKTHEKTHTAEKPFACYQCDTAFAQLNSLKRHERTHTGKKPFPCFKCDKAFTHSGDLKTHERIHTGEKPNVTRHKNLANYIFVELFWATLDLVFTKLISYLY